MNVVGERREETVRVVRMCWAYTTVLAMFLLQSFFICAMEEHFVATLTVCSGLEAMCLV